MAKPCFRSSPGIKAYLRISVALIILVAVSSSGCGVETLINEDVLFKFIHHPEAYLQADVPIAGRLATTFRARTEISDIFEAYNN